MSRKHVRITQIDGKYPNLALMRLSSWHKRRGDHVYCTKSIYREDDEENIVYDYVYGSTIFASSIFRTAEFMRLWPNAVVGGTGNISEKITVEDLIGEDWRGCDYSLWPDFKPSLGFTSRGCRMRCKFCVVPLKEGKPRFESTVNDIWRGVGHKKYIHLLDNDFFGQERSAWKARIAEIIDGNFKVCFNQGINIRLINDEVAEALGSIEYRDDQFERRRLYGAWDSLKDEGVFFRGVNLLVKHGINPQHLMIYMLVGFDKSETFERIMHRFNRLVGMGIKPYPMVYGYNRELKRFQRWVITGLYKSIPFKDYTTSRSVRKGRGAPCG